MTGIEVQGGSAAFDSSQPHPAAGVVFPRRSPGTGVRWPAYGSVLGEVKDGRVVVRARDLAGKMTTATGAGDVWHLDHIVLEGGIEVRVWIGGVVATWDDGADTVFLAAQS